MSKIKAGKPVGGTVYGTTLTNSHPLRFNKGNAGGSKPNGIEVGPSGSVTFCKDEPAVRFPKASTSPSAKVKKTGTSPGFVPKGKGLGSF